MSKTMVRLSFFKLNVEEMEPALDFWRDAFGFEVARTFDESEFLEHVLALPGQENGPSLMIVRYKDGRSIEVGNGYGPVGLVCPDIAAAHQKAIDCGAVETLAITPIGTVKVSMLNSPQGHSFELVELSST